MNLTLTFLLIFYSHALFSLALARLQGTSARQYSSVSHAIPKPWTHASPTVRTVASLPPELETIRQRRLSNIVGAVRGASNIPTWTNSIQTNGRWPDVDYTTGCAAQRANWPAAVHWQRIVVLAAAWHGGLAGADQYVKNDSLRATISLAMGAWFVDDFTNDAGMDAGGTASCPCNVTDTTLWNTNWYSNIIGVPALVSQSCLLLDDSLTTTELSNCTHMTSRSYSNFGRTINGVGTLTGANTLDVAKIGIDLGLFSDNSTIITDAYSRIHAEAQIVQAVQGDGIRPDGSFGQHAGIIYNGNYGKDYTNDLLDLEIEAAGTQFEAPDSSKTALSTLVDGDRWMIYFNTFTKVLHWDFSVLGRFISFPVIDGQATASINLNISKFQELGNLWGSPSLLNFYNSLSHNGSSVNAGHLTGNKMFYDNDYMVQRGANYVSTLRMYSTRTQNTECTNSQNPFGFHLSDGTLYTYIQGNEYEDIAAAWDWNLIPGTTVDYGATPLDCSHTRYKGLQAFVGGVSNGKVGIGAMRYTNPDTHSLSWQKAWFFLKDDIQHVMISNISSSSNASVYSVLDQRRHAGGVFLDSKDQSNSLGNQLSYHRGTTTLWHGNVGYALDPRENATLSLQVGEKTGNWSAIGISTQPPPTVDLFAAWLQHDSLNSSVSYTAFPGTDYGTFMRKQRGLKLSSHQNDGHISALFDASHNMALAVFWDATGGVAHFDTPGGRFNLSADGNAAVVFDVKTGNMTVADPSQFLTSLTVMYSPESRHGSNRTLVFSLPSSGSAGGSVTQNVYLED